MSKRTRSRFCSSSLPRWVRIVELLGDGPLDADTLGRAAGLGSATLAGALLELELGGVVVRQGARLSLAL